MIADKFNHIVGAFNQGGKGYAQGCTLSVRLSDEDLTALNAAITDVFTMMRNRGTKIASLDIVGVENGDEGFHE